MIDSLRGFNEGLIEYGLQFRSEKNKETIDQAIKRELSDMTRLLLELNKINDSAKRTLTEGMVKYAMGFYLFARREHIKNYHQVIESILNYFYSMDEKYYSSLEGKSFDMEQLVDFLNEKDI